MTNVIYDNILIPLQKLISTNMKKVPVQIGTFKGNNSIRITPMGQIQDSPASNLAIDYLYTILIDYKNNRNLDTRAITNESEIILETLNKNPHVLLDNGKTAYFDANVNEVTYEADLDFDEDEEQFQFRIEYSCKAKTIYS